jgi:hypothetical protein
MKKFHGNLDQLRNAVAALGYVGVWEEKLNGAPYWVFKAKTGEILNWYETTGSLLYQGNNPIELKRGLEQREFERQFGKSLF